MDYNHVAVFVQVVKAGGFSAAARALGLPKSSVSRTIALLEQDLRVRLLQRTTRRVTPTDAGASLYDAVKSSVNAIDEADALVREHGGAPQGVVRMTVPPDLEQLPRMLTQFSRKYPGVQIEVSVSSRFVDLVGEGFDLAIRAGTLEDSSLVARRIGGANLAIVAAPSYLRRRGRPKTWEALADHDWVLYHATAGRRQVRLYGPDGPRVLEATSMLSSDDLSFIRRAVVAGAGLGLLPSHTVSDAIARDELVRVLPKWSTRVLSMYVVLPSSRFVPARVALLRDFLVEQLGRELQSVSDRA